MSARTGTRVYEHLLRPPQTREVFGCVHSDGWGQTGKRRWEQNIFDYRITRERWDVERAQGVDTRTDRMTTKDGTHHVDCLNRYETSEIRKQTSAGATYHMVLCMWESFAGICVSMPCAAYHVGLTMWKFSSGTR